LTGGALLIFGVVIAHQSLILGRLSGPSQNAGSNFYLGQCDVHVLRLEPGLDWFFETPVAAQLGRGRDVDLPDHHIWDQDFFFSEGLRCISADGLLHARVLVRNIFDMGLSTIPWPAVNEDGLRDVAKASNVAYVLLLPFIVIESIRLIRRPRPLGGGRGEAMLLWQLSLVLVTALVFLSEPRYRTPYDVFGLALLGSIIADRFFAAPQGRPPDTGQRHFPPVFTSRRSSLDPETEPWRASTEEAPAHAVREESRLGQGAGHEDGQR
jgi:hypothetical protein